MSATAIASFELRNLGKNYLASACFALTGFVIGKIVAQIAERFFLAPLADNKGNSRNPNTYLHQKVIVCAIALGIGFQACISIAEWNKLHFNAGFMSGPVALLAHVAAFAIAHFTDHQTTSAVIAVSAMNLYFSPLPWGGIAALFGSLNIPI